MECPKEFDDIRPFYDSEFHDKMKVLVTEPGFEHAVRYVLRDINYELFCQELLTIDNKKDFQLLVMRSFLEGLTQKTTKGLTGNNLAQDIERNHNITNLYHNHSIKKRRGLSGLHRLNFKSIRGIRIIRV